MNTPKNLSQTADANRVFRNSNIEDCHIVQLPRIAHVNGSLSFQQNTADAPFTIKRVYYLYDIPGDSSRGGHAHKANESLLIAVSGSFTVTLSDGHHSRQFFLNRPYMALHIPPGFWREINDFSSGAVCLVLTSEIYDEDDYVRDFNTFKQLTQHKITE
jgi:dTDP-4-dehydrorhamnose 3,5-epimerase-like enzyme